jgi:hypothetical protein
VEEMVTISSMEVMAVIIYKAELATIRSMGEMTTISWLEGQEQISSIVDQDWM